MKLHISVLGIDIAKRLFHVVGMNEGGHIVLRKRLARHAVMPCIAALPPCSSVWKPVAGRLIGRDDSANITMTSNAWRPSLSNLISSRTKTTCVMPEA
jgi:hypothetical protein